MSEEFTPAYDTLQSNPDNIEVIRDQIAALLALDLEHQFELAVEDNDPNAADYDVDVFVESDDPLQYVDDDTDESNPFPCVNVSLDSSSASNATAGVNAQKFAAQVLVDCYATGNTSSDADFGTKASLKAWKVARLVRRILRAEPNTYLRMRGVVGGISWKFQAGSPSQSKSAINVKMVRITLTIEYAEDVAITGGVLDWNTFGLITDENGQVIVG